MSGYTLRDSAGDLFTITKNQPTARTGQITLRVTEHFDGRTYSAAVHVDPDELITAVRAMQGSDGSPIRFAKDER